MVTCSIGIASKCCEHWKMELPYSLRDQSRLAQDSSLHKAKDKVVPPPGQKLIVLALDSYFIGVDGTVSSMPQEAAYYQGDSKEGLLSNSILSSNKREWSKGCPGCPLASDA